jgi:hypothetical protein
MPFRGAGGGYCPTMVRPMATLLRQAVADQYDDWRIEGAETEQAYRRWATAEHDSQRRAGFHAYRAALRREEQACELYAKLIDAAAGAAGPPVGRPSPLPPAGWA